jgi:hypothetical protein
MCAAAAISRQVVGFQADSISMAHFIGSESYIRMGSSALQKILSTSASFGYGR